MSRVWGSLAELWWESLLPNLEWQTPTGVQAGLGRGPGGLGPGLAGRGLWLQLQFGNSLT